MVGPGGTTTDHWQPVAGRDGGIEIGWLRPQVWRLAILAGLLCMCFPLVGQLVGSSRPTDVVGFVGLVLIGLMFSATPLALFLVVLIPRSYVVLHGDGIELRRPFGRPKIVPWSAVDGIDMGQNPWFRNVRLRTGGRRITLPVPFTAPYAPDPDFDAKVEFVRAWCEAGRRQPIDRRPPPPNFDRRPVPPAASAMRAALGEPRARRSTSHRRVQSVGAGSAMFLLALGVFAWIPGLVGAPGPGFFARGPLEVVVALSVSMLTGALVSVVARRAPSGRLWITDRVLVYETAYARLTWLPWSTVTAIGSARYAGTTRIEVSTDDGLTRRLTVPSAGWLVQDEDLDAVLAELIAAWRASTGDAPAG